MKRLILFLIVSFPLIGYAQPAQFTNDSIPTVDGKVVFNVNFEFDLSKEEFRKRAYSYLNNELNPYSGMFHPDKGDYTTCQITDYIDIENSLFQKFGMYMTYNLQLEYKERICTMVIRDISYMTKGYFEADVDKQRKQTLPKYSAKDIMINQNYSLMLIKNASERITDASLKRINEIINGLNVSFVKK